MNRLHDWAIRHAISPAAFGELLSLFRTDLTVQEGESEGITQGQIRTEAPKFGGAMWRNNSGAYLDETGRMVRYGLGNDSKKLNEVYKSSDLIGITPVNWHGRTFGVFTAVEIKHPDWKAPENKRDMAQQNFIVSVESMGGIAMFATSLNTYQKRLGL